LDDASKVSSTDGFTPLWVVPLKKNSIRMVFLDPPYDRMHDQSYRQQLAKLLGTLYDKLESGGVIALRSHKADAPLAPESANNSLVPRARQDEQTKNYTGPRTSIYGNMAVHLYQKPLE